MSLKTKFFITCEICGVEKELDRVYGYYYSFMACTPNNQPGKLCVMDGFMCKEIELCQVCGGKVSDFIKSSKS
ncbi:hypothetical protein C4577_01885 [Candidatus Parcubacteria bacterium]|nr:MAG: hypothetical protein C4577_01885 [Candidatus Parcubacteria bacterium]